MATHPCVSAALHLTASSQSTSEQWLHAAKADFRLCREFARRFEARLPRSLRSQRVGWETFGHVHCALLLPDARTDGLANDEWHLYYVSGESLFRQGRARREELETLILAESAEDWAELLHQALREQVFDVQYAVTPDYVNVLGEVEQTRSGFVFALEAYAPQAVSTKPLRIAGAGATPEQAAREACLCWLAEQGNETTTEKAGGCCVTR